MDLSLFDLVPGWVWLIPIGLLALVGVGLFAFYRYEKWKQKLIYDVDRQREQSERWARRRDVADLVGKLGEDSRRLPLGQLLEPKRSRRDASAQLLTPRGSAVLVVAPSQVAGKTTRIAVPTCLHHRGPAAIFGAKADIVFLTMKARKAIAEPKEGPVYIFDPTNSMGLGSACWDLVGSVKTYDDAKRVGTILANSANHRDAKGSGMGDKAYWETLAQSMIAPLIFRAAMTDRQIQDIYVDIATSNRFEQIVENDLKAAVPESRFALADWQSFRQTEERPKGSIIATARGILSAWGSDEISPAVDRRYATGPVIDFEDLTERNGTLYAVAPPAAQETYKSLFTSLASGLVRWIQDWSAAHQGMPLSPRLLMCLEETANIAPLWNLSEIASMGSGQGIMLMTVWQDWNQAIGIYGPEIANTIRSNHRTKIFMAGITDPDTLRYMRELLGTIFVQVAGSSVDSRGRVSMSASQTQVDLLPESNLREMSTKETIAVVGERRPMRVRMDAWYESKAMRSLVDAEVAALYDAEHAQEEQPEVAR